MSLKLNLRTRVELFKGSGKWQEVTVQQEFPTRETAILICDMWAKHWCKSATQRCEAMVPKINHVIDVARKKGVQIIHSPSGYMDFYKDKPQRQIMMTAPPVTPPETQIYPSIVINSPPIRLHVSEPPLPIDDSDQGCDDIPKCKGQVVGPQNPGIQIAENDWISDNGVEIYSMFRQRGIKNLIIMGVHTNMCVLGRSFGIRQMSRWGIQCILVRDLTDSMYNPRMPPHVSHDEGTALVVQHIEKYWCPSVLSRDIIEQ